MKPAKFLGALAVAFVASGCPLFVRNVTDVTDKNRANVGKLSVGMTRADVMAVMGPDDSYSVIAFPVLPPLIYVMSTKSDPSPYRTETYVLEDGQTAEVLFFHTDITRRDGVTTEDELTPVVLLNGKVIGWGNQFLQGRATEIRLR